MGRARASDHGGCLRAHVLHDGYTDLFYVLLPIWQAECGLGYAEIGALRALYGGSMASFQVPAGIIAERLGGPLILGLGTALSAKLLKPVRLPPGRTMSHACRWRLKAEKGPQERRRVLFGA